MKNKIFVIVLVLITAGCSTIHIPKYIPDNNPYKREVYASFSETLDATTEALEETGWEVVDTTDPSVFEHSTLLAEDGQEILIFSGVKSIPLVLGTRFARVNVYLRSMAQPNATEVEVRYLTINSVGFKNFNNFKHPIAVEHILDEIEKNLN